jgi:hypothetical protein
LIGLGTDAASEGVNLRRPGTLINFDLPWNPTRLEERKGRIQRIGKLNDTVYVYNMRYLGSVEDRVHEVPASRLEEIHTMFGQIPDVLEDVWIDIANGEIERAKQVIESVPRKHPFDIRYQRIEKTNWESCARVLSSREKRHSQVVTSSDKPSIAAGNSGTLGRPKLTRIFANAKCQEMKRADHLEA